MKTQFTNQMQMDFGITAAAITAGAAIAGQGIQMGATKLNNTKNFERQKQLMDKQFGMNQQAAAESREGQYDLWKKTGPVGQMEQLKQAGLNPGLMYGKGDGGGGSTAAIPTEGPSGAGYHGDNPGAGAGGMGIMVGSALAKTKAEIDLLNAQTQALKAKAGLDVAETPNAPLKGENIQASTENLKAEYEGKLFTSKEIKDVYEQVKQPNRGIEAKTWEDELSARQGVAGTVYELWTEGKLKDKSLAEIENMVASGAKTREETKNIQKQFDLLEENLKGMKLENAMKKIEADLQTETGIDRNSPYWLKTLGRLFVKLMGGN